MSKEDGKRGLFSRFVTLPFMPVHIAATSFSKTAGLFTKIVSKTQDRVSNLEKDEGIQKAMFKEASGVLKGEDFTDEDDLRFAGMVKRYNITGYVFMTISFSFLAFSAYNLFQGELLTFLFFLIFSGTNGIAANRNLFRSWQVKQRKLGTMRQYWDTIS